MIAPARPAAARELTIHEPELRRLQDAIEAIARGERQVRLGLNGERPSICYCGLESMIVGLSLAADVVRHFRPADLRPELSEQYLAQVVDDLLSVECTAEEVDLRCSERVRREVATARACLNRAMLAMRVDLGVIR